MEQHDAGCSKVGSNGRMFRPAMYSQMYRLTTVPESNDKGKWFGWEVARIGDVDRAEVYEAAKSFAQSISAGEVKIKHEAEGGISADTLDNVPF